MFSPAAARGASGRLNLLLSDQSFFWTLADGQVNIGRGELPHADATLAGAATAVASIVYGGRPLEDALAAGDLTAAGDLDLIRRLPSFFPLPDKASDRIS